jgi:broad specificity phosphatase PhoE
MSSQTTTLILCRHGESEGNLERRFGGHGPTPLTPRGREQARSVGRALSKTGVDVLYTSDLVRAAETAALIGEAIGLQADPTSALRERSVGELTGLTFEEAQARFPNAYAELLRRAPDACPPGGESVVQCRARAVDFLDQALVKHVGARIVLVSHNVTLHQLILHLLGLPDSDSSKAAFFQIDNCSLHHFERVAARWKVIAINERAHLVDPLP